MMTVRILEKTPKELHKNDSEIAYTATKKTKYIKFVKKKYVESTLYDGMFFTFSMASMLELMKNGLLLYDGFFFFFWF